MSDKDKNENETGEEVADAAELTLLDKCVKKLESIKTDVEAIPLGDGVNPNFPLKGWINPSIQILKDKAVLTGNVEEVEAQLKELIKPLKAPECLANEEARKKHSNAYPYNLPPELAKLLG